jgi:hypothetical protein
MGRAAMRARFSSSEKPAWWRWPLFRIAAVISDARAVIRFVMQPDGSSKEAERMVATDAGGTA